MEEYCERYHMNDQNFLGLTGFVWWIGVVENRLDLLNLGRLQVRIFGWHTDNLQLIPSAELPWASPVRPIVSVDAVPREGEWVMGFFMDGKSGQIPYYLGVFSGIPDALPDQSKGFSDQRTPDQLKKSPRPLNGQPQLYPNTINQPTTSRLYRNEDLANTIIAKETAGIVYNTLTAAGTSWSQPAPSYQTVPPYNRVVDTESGHVMEFDDTPSAERLHLAHRTGTYTEMRPDGSKVTRVVKDNYEVISGDDFVVINGVCNITVHGNANLRVDGVLNTQVAGDYNVSVGGNYNIDVFGQTNNRYEGKYEVWFGGDTLTRKRAGLTDYACPSDVRNGGIDCSEVPNLAKP